MSVNNPRFPHTCKITRSENDNPLADESEPVVIYSGKCRGYTKNTTSIEGEVITSNRGLSLPLAKDDWTEKSIPMIGDDVEVNYGPYTEHGQIIDRIAASFHGTHLIWKHDSY